MTAKGGAARQAGPAGALAVVAAAALASYDRVLTGGAWFLPAVAAAWVATAVTAGWRSVGLWRATSVAASSGVGVWFVLLVLYPESTAWGLPTPSALLFLAGEATGAWERIERVAAPVTPDAGYMALLLAASWLAASVSAALAGGRSSVLAPLPWIAAYGFAAAVGQGGGRRLFMTLVLAAVLAYLLSDARRPGGSPHVQGRTAVRMGAVSMAGALLVPGLLPGSSSPPLVPWTTGPSKRTAISPIVQIRPRLTERPSQPLFQVTADRPAYWRLTALSRFDGNTWQGEGSYARVRGAIQAPPGRTRAVRQRVRVTGLGGIWLPAAYAPATVEGVTASVDPVTHTLVAGALRNDLTYRVVSRAPDPTPAELREAAGGGEAPPGHLDLPPRTRARIGPIARAIVGDAPTPYEAAVALQSHLQGFRYDENVPPGHSGDYLVRFLTEVRAGYCEQFAGAMAVMLRTLGIPSRVAVGFLPGPAEDGVHTVTTDEAHAWPEAYFDGIGWIPFEPTPRPQVVPPSYSVPEAEQVPSPAAVSPAPASPASPTPEQGLEDLEDAGAPEDSRAAAVDAARRASRRVVTGLAGLLAALLLLRELALRVRGSLGGSPQARVAAAFREFSLRAADAVGPRWASETEAEYAAYVARALSLPAGAIAPLVAASQRAAYSPRPPDAAEVRAARTAVRRLGWLLLARAGLRARARLLFSPRPLLPPLPGRRARAAGAPGA